MYRLLQMIFAAVKARASYATRIWTALFLPLPVGIVFGWSIRTKLEALLVSVLVAAAFTAAKFVEKKHFR